MPQNCHKRPILRASDALLSLLECKQAEPKESNNGGGNDDMADQLLESRVARLEADVANIRSDIAEMKLGIRELRAQIAEVERKLISGLASNRIWMLLQSAALLGVMARGFKWL